MPVTPEPYEWTENDKEAFSYAKNDLIRIVCDGKKWDDVSCIQFINAIKTALQLPTALTIYKKKKDNYIYQFTTWSDPLGERDLDNHLNKELNDYIAQDILIPIYNTDYYLLVLVVNREDEPKNGENQCPVFFAPYPYDKGCINIIRKLLDVKEIEKDEYLNWLTYLDFWQENLDFSYIAHKISECPPFRSDNQEMQRDLLSYIRNNIINPSYARIYSSRALNHSDSLRPPNIFYFLRSYDSIGLESELPPRYGYYHYRVRMIIAEKQREHIKKAFEHLRDTVFSKPLRKGWRFSDADQEMEHFNNNDEEYVSLFKNELCKIKNKKDKKSYNGIERILDILESPYSEHTRSLVDASFSTAFVSIRRVPLASKLGFDHVHLDHENDPKLCNEKIRIAALFYLYSIVFPYGGGRIAAMIRPLNVGYSPWLSFLTLSEFKDKDDQRKAKSRDREAEDYKNWRRFHNFSYYICGEKQSIRIRSAIDQGYLALIKKWVSNTIMQSFLNHSQEKNKGKLVPLDQLVDAFNGVFFEFCRFFPYERVVFSMDHSQNDSGSNIFAVILSDDNVFYGKFCDNPYFPSFERKRGAGRDESVPMAITNGVHRARELLKSGGLQ